MRERTELEVEGEKGPPAPYCCWRRRLRGQRGAAAMERLETLVAELGAGERRGGRKRRVEETRSRRLDVEVLEGREGGGLVGEGLRPRARLVRQ